MNVCMCMVFHPCIYVQSEIEGERERFCVCLMLTKEGSRRLEQEDDAELMSSSAA